MKRQLYLFPTTPVSPAVAAIHDKVRTLDRRGDDRALTLIGRTLDQFLATPVLTAAERRAQTIAFLRACGATLCVAYLEQQVG